jgi:acylglycerol lipase
MPALLRLLKLPVLRLTRPVLSGARRLTAVAGRTRLREARTPAIENGHFVTRDGLALRLCHWDAPTPRAIIVAVHGMNDYSNAFAIPAPLWAQKGITTYAYDQRGFGRSPQIGLWPDADVMRLDVTDFVDVVRSLHPGLPVVVLGESMGGAVALSAFASANPPAAQACVLVAPAVWGWSALPFAYRVALWIAVHVLPRWGLTGEGHHLRSTDNDDVQRAYKSDPLFYKTARTEAIYRLVELMGKGVNAASHLGTLPVLLLYGGNDQIIPRLATEVFAAMLGPNATVKFYPDGYHMLLRDHAGAAHAEDVAEWIEAITQQIRFGSPAPAAQGASTANSSAASSVMSC